MLRHGRAAAVLLALALVGACAERGIDWSAPENFLYREKSENRDDGMQLSYSSLVDARCQPVYEALADVAHYADFIPGVDRTQILTETPNSKTIQIAQRVIGRQSNAKVEWTFDSQKRQIAFKTLASDLNFNDGHYEFEDSPDGKRCLVRTVFLVRHGEGRAQAVPIGVLAAGTRDAFLAAAQGVKKRAAAAP